MISATHPHAQLIETFYTAFQKRDAEGMVRCYHPAIRFSDPVFHTLEGPRAGAMWRMLCERATSLEVTFRDVRADATTGSAHWEARYLFSATGRQVHNVVDAAFEFQDGKISRHADTFDLWRWAGMALGPKGRLLGWLPPIQKAIHQKAVRGLAAFEQAKA
ncbi:MAG: nuclear transport factor 2 family protein [Deltaproteobacteria bacterium]|nr:nuclear transport factor 2 family protein [Deltaproteobacteria bacterium]